MPHRKKLIEDALPLEAINEVGAWRAMPHLLHRQGSIVRIKSKSLST